MTTSRAMARRVLSLGICSLVMCSVALGQGHPLFRSNMPTGEIARRQVARRPQLLGVFQPVLVKAPSDAIISVAEGPGFTTDDLGSTLVGLQVGETYRLRVSNIPHQFGEVYPTIELLDRMHAPAGKETRYPIPVELTQRELEMALAGKFVTRVIYVENPRNALPVRDLPEQRYLEVLPNEDPLHVADVLGRPVAILRMGSLTPGAAGPSAEFLFGSPPLERHAVFPAQPEYVPSQLRPDALQAKPLTPPSSPKVIERQNPTKEDAANEQDGPLEVLNPFRDEAQEESANDAAPVDELQDADLGDLFDPDEPSDLDDVDLDADDPFEDF